MQILVFIANSSFGITSSFIIALILFGMHGKVLACTLQIFIDITL